ncbi:MAG TPA: DUF4872 domain-containing protein [Chloroflexota bacterium]
MHGLGHVRVDDAPQVIGGQAVSVGITGSSTQDVGHLAESSCLRGLLAPHVVLGEPLAFGIGGGIGAAYWVFEYKGLPAPLVSILTRFAWDSSQRFLEEGCRRLGATSIVKETGSATVAQRNLDQALADGRSAIVWVSRALSADNDLPPEMADWAGEIVLVRASGSGDSYRVEDRGTPPFELSRDELAHTRSVVKRDKHRLLSVDPPGQEPIDVGAAVRDGMRACARELLAPPMHLPAMAASNSALNGFRKLAQLMADPRDPRGWPRLFPPGRPLHSGLVALYRALGVGGGGALRPLYAAFLDEAAALLADPRLTELGVRYRELGTRWSALAESALPDDVALLARTRALLVHRRAVFVARGAAAASEIHAIDAELRALEDEATTSFPLDAAGCQALLSSLSAQLTEIVRLEQAAAEQLAAAAG